MTALALRTGAVGLDAQGQVEVCAVASDGAIWVIQQTSPNGPGWSGWQSLGGLTGLTFNSLPVVAANGAGPLGGPGRLELFVVGSDGALWHNPQVSPGQWSGWFSLGGAIVGIPGVGKNPDSGGRLEVFAKGADTALWHIWQMPPTSTVWSAWNSLGGQVNEDGPPIVGVNRGAGPLNNCLQVFVFANPDPFQSHYDYLVQPTPGGAPWSAWTSLGGWLGAGSCLGQNQDGRLELFAVGQNVGGNHLSHNYQPIGQGATTTWSGWSDLPNCPQGPITPTVAQNVDGRLEVFGIGQDGALWHIWQTAANNGWSGWQSLGAPGAGLAPLSENCFVTPNQDGHLEAFVIAQDGSLCHIWQTTAPSATGWSGWGAFGLPSD